MTWRAGLLRLLRPDTVAVIGGGAWCRSVLAALDGIGFPGQVFHVHPGAEGAFRSAADLPEAPDAAFVGINREGTIEAVRTLAAKGAGGAVCFASGFAESADGQTLNASLLAAAGDMAIVGPNCYGFVNALDRAALWPDVHGLAPVDSGVAILTQSSNIALNISMQRRGLPIAFLGTVGNQAQTGLSEMGAALIADPRVTALGLHLEGVGDLATMQALACEAAARGKPVYVLKTGRSEAAQIAAVSHTASLSGSDAGAEALFARLGLRRLHRLDAFLEALKHAHLFGAASGGEISSLSCSGGEASLMADGAAARGLRFASLTSGQDAALADLLGPMVTRANPLDYHTFIWGDTTRMAEVFTTMAVGPAALTVIVVDFPHPDRCHTGAWDCVVAAARVAQRRSGKHVALMATLAENMPEHIALSLMRDGLLPLCGMEAGLDALAALPGRRETCDPNRAIPLPRPGGSPRLLDEAEAKSVLRAAGLDVPRGRTVAGCDGLAAVAEGLYPVALKARGLSHKTEAGGVALNIADADGLRKAAAQMGARQFHVEEMIVGGVAELLVAILADPAHGYVLTLGAGGVLAELWADTQALLVPASAAEIDAALDRLRIAPLIDGYRGAPAGNRACLIDAIRALQDHVVARRGRVTEIEINPFILTPARAVVADALIRED